ncbi:MarR family winged helix-turn-helix transcriptional regulator [Vallicoccus soli]|uniref:MarR family transcriptional regulator n=1 Tax=Vallicoccus soli TaxID=2339232 RepID=A0A3A3Z0G0_9ACTN|nr:MarR family transcriptional regulator [Vallicoccus soli]
MQQLVGEALERQLQQDAGMPHAYYAILARLSHEPGRAARMSDLAAAVQQSQSRLSHAVARLEAAGWVRRERCASDRRGNLAVLTDDGAAALRAAAPGHVEQVRRALFDPLSREEARLLGELAERVVAAHGVDLDAQAGVPPRPHDLAS